MTKRVRTRALKSGTVTQQRFVLDYKDPATARRRQEFFARKADAERRRDELLELKPTQARVFAPQEPERGAEQPSVKIVVDYWLTSLSAALKTSTVQYYHQMARYVITPTPMGTPAQRRAWSRKGKTPAHVPMLQPLGDIALGDLSTQRIRAWHAALVANVGQHTANAAKKLLGSALRLASEELGARPPVVPRTTQRRKGSKLKKRTLTLEQVSTLMKAANEDQERGIYYAFPFLTGVRPSEQLGLLWRDVDLKTGVIHIRRMQEVDGSLCDFTKTESSTREIPVSPMLRALLLRWRTLSPTGGRAETRVFVTLGSRRSARHGMGEPLTYYNFRNTYWRPALRRLGLPDVAPHSARHTFISTLQARGTEVGLVAKLAGHANPNITLGYYTQAVRDGVQPLKHLDQAYQGIAPVSNADAPAS